MTELERGFPDAEYSDRTARAQDLMAASGLDALLLTTEPEVRYYSGFLTRFWESPTRPWFLVVPVSGKPIAVIPSIGTQLMSLTWLDDIRSWSSPNYEDDGVSLLAETLCEIVPIGGKVGLADAIETHVRMPQSSLRTLSDKLVGRNLVGDAAITRRLRLVKSEAEISKIAEAVEIGTRAFNRVPEIASAGMPLSKVFRDFQRLCLEEGADWVPYLAGAADRGGYGDVISPASDAPIEIGDVLMLDSGLVWDGYFCDFDRNFSIGPPAPEVAAAHERLIDATAAGFEVSKPGSLISDVFHAMQAVADPGGLASDAGRMGHGLGMQLTEWPSIIAEDHTLLMPGMVLTLEPSVSLGDGRLLVHEENIVIRDDGPAYLTLPEARELRVI